MPNDFVEEKASRNEAPSTLAFNGAELLGEKPPELKFLGDSKVVTGSAVVSSALGMAAKNHIDEKFYSNWGSNPPNQGVAMHPETKAPIWTGEAPSHLKGHFESSQTTKALREASSVYTKSEAAFRPIREAMSVTTAATERMVTTIGAPEMEKLLKSCSNGEAVTSLKTGLRSLDPIKLDALALKPKHAALIYEARAAALSEAGIIAKYAGQGVGYDKAVATLSNPMVQSEAAMLKSSLRDAGIAIGANLALDYGAKKLAGYCLGTDSQVARSMDTNALSMGLSTFGYVAGGDAKSKLGFAAVGWAAGKVYNFSAISDYDEKMSSSVRPMHSGFQLDSQLLGGYARSKK